MSSNKFEKIAKMKTPLYYPGQNYDGGRNRDSRSPRLQHAEKVRSEYANIIIKEDKLRDGLYSLINKLGITDNDDIQLLKRYFAFKESSAYAQGVKDGENGMKEELRFLLNIKLDEHEDDW